MRITVTLYLEKDDHEKIKTAAERVNRPISNYCRQVLTTHARALNLDKPPQDITTPKFL